MRQVHKGCGESAHPACAAFAPWAMGEDTETAHPLETLTVKRPMWTLCVAALVALALAPVVLGAEPKAATEPAAQPAPGDEPKAENEKTILAREAGLNAEQKARLDKTVAEAQATMTAWEKANEAKIQVFNQAVAAARQAQDQDAFRKAVTDAKPLLQERRDIQVKYDKQIMDILTADQKATWIGFLLSGNMTRQAKPLNLTPEQVAKVRALCNAAGKELIALPEPKEGDPNDPGIQARMAVQQKLMADFTGTVLTDEQKATMKALIQPQGGGLSLEGDPVAPPKQP